MVVVGPLFFALVESARRPLDLTCGLLNVARYGDEWLDPVVVRSAHMGSSAMDAPSSLRRRQCARVMAVV
jgi:hypothetical protein